jgi:hypothetical protein
VGFIYLFLTQSTDLIVNGLEVLKSLFVFKFFTMFILKTKNDNNFIMVEMLKNNKIITISK